MSGERKKFASFNFGQPIDNPVSTVRDFYSAVYTCSKEDSPDKSRASLCRRAKPHISGFAPEEIILDLGAGRQIFPRQFIASYGSPNCRILTLDIAEIARRQLLAVRNGVNHIRSNAAHLPFGDHVFSMVVSNMALDFMPKDAFSELYRVTKTGGHLLINLHHPSLIPDDLDDRLKDYRLKPRKRIVYLFWQYLRDHNVLFYSDEEISSAFTNVGFSVHRIEYDQGNDGAWWEVDMIKPAA